MLQRGRPREGPKRLISAMTRRLISSFNAVGPVKGRRDGYRNIIPAWAASLQRGRAREGPKRLDANLTITPPERFNAVGPVKGRRGSHVHQSGLCETRFNAVGPVKGRRGWMSDDEKLKAFVLQRGRPREGPKSGWYLGAIRTCPRFNAVGPAKGRRGFL